MKAAGATLAGSIVSGILASACCLGPLVLSLLGVSGAALARQFEPFRPYLLALSYGLLGSAFYVTYRPGKAECAPGEACAMPRGTRAGRAMVWVGTVVMLLATLFPVYSAYIF
jgi:mercuric ion transport protein